MAWQTWTKVSSVILFIIAILGFYYSTYYTEGSTVTIQNFPSVTELDSLDPTEDITFSFFIYNEGGETAFVRSVIVLEYDEDQNQVTVPVTISPRNDFAIQPGETKEVVVTLAAPGEEARYTLAVEVFYDGDKVTSATVPVQWGSLL